MYPVSDDYLSAVYQPTRVLSAKIVVEGGETYNYTDALQSMVITELCNTGDDLQPGSCCSASLDFVLIPMENSVIDSELDGKTVIPYIGLEVDGEEVSVPLGYFIVTESKMDENNKLQAKAADRMSLFNRSYDEEQITFPCTLLQFVENLCDQAGVSLSSSSFPNSNYILSNDFNADAELRTMLGYAAQAAGSYARFNREGKLELGWYSPPNFPVSVTSESYWSLKFTGHSIPPIDKVTIKTEEDDLGISYGEGENEFSFIGNPLFFGLSAQDAEQQQIVLSKLLERIGGLSYTPFTCNLQGNPALIPGDIISIVKKDGTAVSCPVMQQKLSYSGGLNAELETKGKSDSDTSPRGVTSQKIIALNKKANIIERNLDETTSRINETYTKDETTTFLDSKLTQTKDSIEMEISETYSTKNELQTLKSSLEQRIDGLSLDITGLGVSNLIKNSVGWDELNDWEASGTEVASGSDLKMKTISGSGFLINGGSIRQSLDLISGERYSLGVRVASTDNPIVIKIQQPDSDIIILEDTLTSDYSIYTKTFTAGTQNSLIITAGSINGGSLISDLILCAGSTPVVWSAGTGECSTRTISMTRSGIRVKSSEAETETIMDNRSFRVEYQGSPVIDVNKELTTLQAVKTEDLTVGVIKMVTRKDGLDIIFID